MATLVAQPYIICVNVLHKYSFSVFSPWLEYIHLLIPL